MRTLCAVFVLAFACLCPAWGDVGNLHPDAVLGKPGYTTPTSSTNPRTISCIRGIAFDTLHHRVYAVEEDKSRVLWWNDYASLTNGKAADGVLGQRDMYSKDADERLCSAATLSNPYGVAVDTSGNVWVSDQGEKRVLRYDWPVTSGMNASIVLGQTNFTSWASGLSSSTLNYPRGLALDDAGNLWVADSSNNRVLEFAGPSFTNGQGAVRVLGQPDFVTGAAGLTATSLSFPRGIAFDAEGGLWVVDSGNNRVVRFPSSGSTIDATIATVIGGYNKTSVIGGASSQSFGTPESIAIDRGAGRIWVSDTFDNRVLCFANVTDDGAAAVSVIGQPNFTSTMSNDPDFDGNFEGPGPMTLFGPSGIALDDAGCLWVGDNAGCRLLRHPTPAAPCPSADLVLGQGTFWSNAGAAPEAGTLDMAEQAVCDRSGRLYVADSEDNRVLWWNSTASWASGMPAAGVLGQDSFTTRDSSASSRGMDSPSSVAVDSAGDLFVADSGNNRVLIFTAPITSSRKDADWVLGQANFTNTAGNDTNGDGVSDSGLRSAASLNCPVAVAVDAEDRLWVADQGNNRVLRYSPPFDRNYKDADLVLGLPDFVTNGSTPRAPRPQLSSPVSGVVARSASFATTAHSLSGPSGIACDGAGNVWIADTYSSRVLRFAPPFSNGMDASIVLGQSDFVTGTSIFTSPARRAPGASSVVMRSPFPPAGAATLAVPYGVAVDRTGDVWVADSYNNRVLRYAVPLSSGMAACYVLGQQNFTGSNYNDWDNDGTSDDLSGLTFCLPKGVCFDKDGNLWVSDTENGRVLRYNRHYVAPVVSGSSTTATMQMGNFTVNVKVPRGAFTGNADISIAPVIVPPSVNSRLEVTPISFEITDALGSQQPRRAITITIAYRHEDYTDAQAQLLKLALYNPATQTWTLVPTTVDTAQHLLTATISHFSTYAVVLTSERAPSGTVHAYPYPNPFRAGSETMKIEGQPDGTKIEVFTVAGERVRTLPSPDGNGTVTWDGRNDGGKTVASGVYLLSIDGPAGKKRAKVAVQK